MAHRLASASFWSSSSRSFRTLAASSSSCYTLADRSWNIPWISSASQHASASNYWAVASSALTSLRSWASSVKWSYSTFCSWRN